MLIPIEPIGYVIFLEILSTVDSHKTSHAIRPRLNSAENIMNRFLIK